MEAGVSGNHTFGRVYICHCLNRFAKLTYGLGFARNPDRRLYGPPVAQRADPFSSSWAYDIALPLPVLLM